MRHVLFKGRATFISFYLPENTFFYQQRFAWARWEGAEQECQDAGVEQEGPCRGLRTPTSCPAGSVPVGRVHCLDLGSTSCSPSTSQASVRILYPPALCLPLPFVGYEGRELLNSPASPSLLDVGRALNQRPAPRSLSRFSLRASASRSANWECQPPLGGSRGY